MLNCVETSQAKKTKGLAVTYRAGAGEMWETCPDSCALKPTVTETSEIDREYEYAVRRAVPSKGQAFLYTHFPPALWGESNSPGKTVFNYSADSLPSAAYHVERGTASVAVVPVDYWDDKSSDKVTTAGDVQGVRCLNETTGVDCGNCGNGKPLCARPDRNYFVVFTAHGAAKRAAGDSTVKGGCYAGGGNVALHWRRLSLCDATDATDAEKVTRFATALMPRSILRHHIAGDLGYQGLHSSELLQWEWPVDYEMTRTFSDNYDLDCLIAEANGITIDDVDQIPLHIVEIIRDYFHGGNNDDK